MGVEQDDLSNILRDGPMVGTIATAYELVRIGIVQDLLRFRIEMQHATDPGSNVGQVNECCGAVASEHIAMR